MSQRAPYGTWASPITPEMVARGGLSARGTLSDLTTDGDHVYWRELRPAEDGRYAVVHLAPGGQAETITPAGFSARTMVHEYGGGAFCVHAGVVFFANQSDQRLYRQELGGLPAAITPEPPSPRAWRYADGCVSPDGRHVFVIRERHEADGQVVNEIVRLDSGGVGDAEIIASGHDFFSNPRVDPEGQQLAWLAWDHPQMPWDGTELWTAALDDQGGVHASKRLTGGTDESILQPEWSPDGRLHFVSDLSGWWNLYRWSAGRAIALAPMDAELGSPPWAFGRSHYAFFTGGRMAVIYTHYGIDHLGILEPDSGQVTPVDTGFTAFNPAHIHTDSQGRSWFIASGPTQSQSIVSYDTGNGELTTWVETVPREFPLETISSPEAIEFPTSSGDVAYALFYPPANADFKAPPGELPPLIVHTHGGPTSAAPAQFHLETLYWTSRGFAVADVNYRGSTGYGRPYRDRLKGFCGIVDVDDCLNAARFLAQQGRIDPRRKAISGGSAGGYVTLCALTFHEDYEAGASYFGVADLESLATDTHKFESHYFDSLVGPYPEKAQLYRDRSPIHFTQRLSRPLILFQGLDDHIVPPDQAERMVEALDRQAIPYAYLAFEDEQHGFRKQTTIVRCLQAELGFYGRVFGFKPADDLPPLDIRHLA